MRLFKALRKDGTTVEYPAYTVDEIPLDNVSRETFVKGKNENAIVYSSNICTFDIETTTIYDGEHYIGFMYIWQFCINGVCVYGRYWHEWINLLEVLVSYTGANLIIYVHNLGFEFQFMRQILQNKYKELEVFAPQMRKPLTVRTESLEFRCSWKLSNMTLEKACQNELGCEYVKAVGDLNYRLYRDPTTEINDIEFGYDMTDVLCLYSYIKAKLHNEGDTLKSIPLTSTGFVRRDCRKSCKKSKQYQSLYSKLTLSVPVYNLLKEARRGGNTSSNRYLTGQIISDVDSFDVKSSYPYQLLTQKFPMTRFYSYGDVADLEEFINARENYALLFRCTFENLKARPGAVDLYLSVDKANAFGGKYKNCNGRIYYAESCNYTLTEIDWKIVTDCYTWDSISVTDMHYAKKDYLPQEIRFVILEYFRQKCELAFERDKNVETSAEYENISYLYMKSKNKLNGIFGMMYTDPVRNIITIDEEGIWNEERPDKLSDALAEYRSNRNNFLYYPWGVWTTAYARLHLHTLICIIGETSIYWDTDSDKANVTPEILKAIEEANEKIRRICCGRGAYVDMPYGREYLGIYEHETSKGAYRRFKTLGAKKYAYEDHTGKLHLTVSGVNKTHGAAELESLENFKPGFVFHRAGGLTLHYNHAPLSKTMIEGTNYTLGKPFLTGDNIGMEDSTYMLGVTQEYAEMLGLNIYVKNRKVIAF